MMKESNLTTEGQNVTKSVIPMWKKMIILSILH